MKQKKKMLEKCFEQKYEVSYLDTVIYHLSFHMYNVQKQTFTEVLQNKCRLATLLKRDSNTGVYLWI